MGWIRAWCLLLCLTLPATTFADLFDRARETVRIDQGRADMSGFSLRGGAGLHTGTGGTTTLLRAQGSYGGSCGAADLGASLKQAFEEIPELMEGLVQQIIPSLPMLVLCYTSPTVCDLGKHFQGLVNAVIQARFGQCQTIQAAMAYGGSKLRGGVQNHCLEDQIAAGVPITTALNSCSTGVTDLRSPSGVRAPRVALIKETLTAAGATQETVTLANALLGEVTLSANGTGLTTQEERPTTAMMGLYERNRTEAQETLVSALEELRDTGQVSDASLRAVSVPGQPVPRAVLEALITLQQAQDGRARYDTMMHKVSTGLAITRLTWQCTELQEQISASTHGNKTITEAEKASIQDRIDSLSRDLANVIQKKEVLEKHLQPAMDALLLEAEGLKRAAAAAGLAAPAVAAPSTPYRTQHPLGYGR